jgi:23S rRNA pseudouridine2604 synthase
MDNEKVRLSKLMAERGLCSRREADELIARGWVKVDGQIVDQLGSKVERSVKVELHPHAQSDLQASVTILLNKPIGYVSGQPEKDYLPAVRLITAETQHTPKDISYRFNLKLQRAHFTGLAPAGRLDIDSQGLLVFTQNGTIAKQLIGENSEVEKEYLVRVQGTLSAQQLQLLNHGLSLDGVALKPAKVEWLNQDQLKFILREGKKRQVRRMCELVGLQILGLKRVRIGKVMLADLPEGSWRFLAPGEKF